MNESLVAGVSDEDEPEQAAATMVEEDSTPVSSLPLHIKVEDSCDELW